MSTLRYLAAHRCSKLDIHEALQGREDDIERKVNIQIVFENPDFFYQGGEPQEDPLWRIRGRGEGMLQDPPRFVFLLIPSSSYSRF